MSDGGAVAPVGPVSEPWIPTGTAWTGISQEMTSFGEGFADGAAFSTAVVGAGLHAVTQLGNGQLKAQLG